MKINGFPWNSNFHFYIPLHVLRSKQMVVRKDKGEGSKISLGHDFFFFFNRQWDSYSPIQGSSKSIKCSEKGKQKFEVFFRRLSGTVEITFFTYPKFLHLPTLTPLIFLSNIQLHQLTYSQNEHFYPSSWVHKGLTGDYEYTPDT